MTLVVAALAACAVTTLQLRHDHRRWPLGDVKKKALLWWCAIVLVDMAVACFGAAGLVQFSLGTLDSLGGVVRMVAVGVLVPLGLRSPVRTAEIRSREEPVGVTYVYDLVRKRCEYALDERITRLRRHDTSEALASAQAAGWTANDLSTAIAKQVGSRQLLGDGGSDRIITAATAAMSLPTDSQRLESLIGIAETERLSSVLDELHAGPPPRAVQDDDLLLVGDAVEDVGNQLN